MPQDYNNTINLPKTEFPMRAALNKREPDMLKSWYDMDLYRLILQRNSEKKRFVLHDGPPFSNGGIHMGTALNKCLKDFIVRSKNMSGFLAPYVPGWDNHGMPIESAIIKQNRLDRKSLSIPEFRDACRDFAEGFVDIQREQFKALGILGRWDRPYLTMSPEFEAEEIRIFGQMFNSGYIYKGKKPVYWCCHDETALAEAEIEYADDICTSVYVKFPLYNDHGRLMKYGDTRKMFFVIWTTTIWTIPGNMAICLGADITYSLVRVPGGSIYIMARDLTEAVLKKANIAMYEIIAELKGSELEYMTARHPLYDRESHIILGEHVTTETGTGCVHTAPGHGREDFDICQKYNREGKLDIDVFVPVDARGHMTPESLHYTGMYYVKASKKILEDLTEAGVLLCSEEITHQYPHCWRCKEPILYRATDQWFCSVDELKEKALASCDTIRWQPEWGYDRMQSMIRERADWCISRQRHWGLPIPVFYCEDCGELICTDNTINRLSQIFKLEGSNAWFDKPAEYLLPIDFTCPSCGKKHFRKETDTLDGWFDSGSTHYASLEREAPDFWPADLYLEGADQFRGWFQSSLLTAVAIRGQAPYRAVLTHGWTVDGEGKAMHKSLGNSVSPDELIPTYGAELVRLWAASADYRIDMRCSANIFKQLSETYLKIRNTARFMLGNLHNFDPCALTSFEDSLPIDKWALTQLNSLVERCLLAYEKYEFFTAVHAIHRFCVVELSNFYLDVLKDRLYCSGTNSPERISAQSAMYRILEGITLLLAPVLAFTTNEIWQHMPHGENHDNRHVMLNDFPKVNDTWRLTDAETARWRTLLTLRDGVNKALEAARNDKLIGKPLDAKITLLLTPEGETAISGAAGISDETAAELAEIFIVSETELIKSGEPADFAETGVSAQAYDFAETGVPGISVKVSACEYEKCPRCWTRSPTIGLSKEHPELCARCAAAIM